MRALLFLCGLLSLVPYVGTAQSSAYTAAYATLQAMLTGQQKPDFRHAVFVVENAWFDNTRNEALFQQQFNTAAQTCQQMVQQRNLQQHRTAGNWAIFMWMTQKVPQNNNQPFRYDFADFTGKENFVRWSREGGQKKDVYFFCDDSKKERVVARQTAQVRRGI